MQKHFFSLARLVAVVTIGGLVLAGASSAGASTASAKPKKGGTFTFLFNAEPPGMDPIQLREIAQISPGVAAQALFDNLVYTDPTSLKVKPKMATSLNSSDKGLTWVLKLNQGIRFSDGTPLDAAAIQYNWQRIADPANRVVFAAPAQEIATYEIPDPLTLKVTLKAANPLWDQLVARNLSTIGSPTALRANAQAFSSKPVAAGPFLLKDWVRGVSMSMVRNPDYWQKGKPYFDAIEIKNIQDDNARYNTLTAGGAQAALDGAWPNITQYNSSGRYAVAGTPANGGGYALTFNFAKAPFDDLRARQAIAMVIDSKEVVERSGDGDETWVIKTIDEKTSPFYNPKMKPAKADPVEAQKLLDAYIAEKNGGKPLDVTYLGLNTPVHVRFATAIQAIITSTLKNITWKLDIVNSVTGVPRQAAGDFQVTSGGPRWADPSLDVPNFFRSTSSLNYGKYKNPAVDAAIEKLLVAVDEKSKQQALDTVIENVLKDVGVVWFMRFRTYYAVEKAAVKNWQVIYELRPFLEEAYLAKPQA